MVYQALQRSGKWGIGRVVFSGKWQIVALRAVEQVLLVHTLYHPAQRRALHNPEGTEVDVSSQELRPLLRIIDSTDGEIPWENYQDDYERRLTKLVEAKVAHAHNPRAARASGKHRSANGASRREVDAQPTRSGSAGRRKAA